MAFTASDHQRAISITQKKGLLTYQVENPSLLDLVKAAFCLVGQTTRVDWVFIPLLYLMSSYRMVRISRNPTPSPHK